MTYQSLSSTGRRGREEAEVPPAAALPPVPTTPLEPLAPTEPAPVPTVETD